MRPRLFPILVALTLVCAPTLGLAQTPTILTLEEALRRAEAQSESLVIAAAGSSRAQADLKRTNSQRYPQISFSGGYDRTLASEFSGVFGGGSGEGGGDIDFSDLPFGQANAYRFTLSGSQLLYTAGRVGTQRQQADVGIRNAELTVAATRAIVQLEVTEAFYNVALSERLLGIAQSGYDQADAAYQQTRQSYEAGRQPEFEVLRAQVQRDNQRPVVIRARANRDRAMLRLRQLLELPADQPIELAVDLEAAELAAPAPFADALAAVQQNLDLASRTSLAQAELGVRLRQLGIEIVRSAKRPTVSFVSQYSATNYPSSVLPNFGRIRNNWTLGALVTMPVFAGFRIPAEEAAAKADLTEAEARLKQARELAALQRSTALQDMEAARAAWEATAGTIAQATRAYEIADLRFREGLSTQLELSDSRLALQSAQANRAQAARDLQLARVRVALLPDLPIQ
ncbi:MAG: TolC family protein [Acidimicrobiia bacterium]|nr:TolC family protein [Acidimicrobiia bacterium]